MTTRAPARAEAGRGEVLAEPGGPAAQILLVAPQPFFRVTGTPINVLMMCQALTEGGIAVDLATLPYGQPVDLPGLRIVRTLRLPFVRDVKVGFSPPKLVYNCLLAAMVAWRLLTRRYHAVHAIEEAAFYAAPLGRLLGVPAVTDIDSDLCRQLRDSGSPLAWRLAGIAGHLRRIALRNSKAALTVAQQMSEIARRDSPETPVMEIRDIPMPEAVRAADPDQVEALRAELGLTGRKPVVYTGNFDRRQGLEELIRALPAVRARHPDVVLVLVGGDPKRAQVLETLAAGLGVEDMLRLTGPRPPTTMPEMMALAAVLASPRLEPYATPLKVFSYMASGRPIVATDLPTHTDVLDGESAVLVPPTPDGLAGGIVRVLDDPDQGSDWGERARTIVHRDHTFAQFKSDLLDLYRHLLGAHTGFGPKPADPTATTTIASSSEQLGHG